MIIIAPGITRDPARSLDFCLRPRIPLPRLASNSSPAPRPSALPASTCCGSPRFSAPRSIQSISPAAPSASQSRNSSACGGRSRCGDAAIVETRSRARAARARSSVQRVSCNSIAELPPLPRAGSRCDCIDRKICRILIKFLPLCEQLRDRRRRDRASAAAADFLAVPGVPAKSQDPPSARRPSPVRATARHFLRARQSRRRSR